jgi:putative hydrolase of the HAD superfamily
VALAVVSNWDSFLPRLLELSGLSPFFRTVSVSAIEGTGKPEPEIFRRTCERLAIETRDALHVGDSLREDFDGARGAGLSALLLDRNDRHPGMADRIRSLSEIPEVLIRSAPSAR